MNNFTIYCTPEQIKRALELGAPIRTTTEHLYNHPHEYQYWVEVDIQGNHYAAKIHTAEQMIGWLRTRGFKFIFLDDTLYWNVRYDSMLISSGYAQDKELAAIDAALDHLENLKQ